MAFLTKGSRFHLADIVVLVCLLAPQLIYGFYPHGSYMHVFQEHDPLPVKVNSLTSIDTALPFGYYTLPFCQPSGGMKQYAESLGELLIGDRIENSPYTFKMNVNESNVVVCVGPALNESQVQMFGKRIDDYYQINLILDDLPLSRFTKMRDSDLLRWTGFPIGFHVLDTYYVFNHLKFRVLIRENVETGIYGQVMGTGGLRDDIQLADDDDANYKKGGYLVVGFEVVPVSVSHRHLNMSSQAGESLPELSYRDGLLQKIGLGEEIVYTYDVKFVKRDIGWTSRWDWPSRIAGARVHWISMLSLLAGILFVVLIRTVRRDLTSYEDASPEAQVTQEVSGWKLVVGDVFRTPSHAGLLCVMVGSGVQITGTAVVTILLGALDFLSVASRGMVLTSVILLFLSFSIPAGYSATRLWLTLNSGDSKGWREVCWRVAAFFPGSAFAILTILNFLCSYEGSTSAISFPLFFILWALWFSTSVPLTALGGWLGAKAEEITFPVRTNQIPRGVPHWKYPSWLLVLGAGTLPFGTLFIEFFFIMTSLWMGRVYYVFGFLSMVLVLLVFVCAEVSVVVTYMQLCAEDWRWSWNSFFASGSCAIYVFLYAINYLLFDLRVYGTVSIALYIGYSLLMALAVMLATGTIGFLTSLIFVYYLFSTVKLD